MLSRCLTLSRPTLRVSCPHFRNKSIHRPLGKVHKSSLKPLAYFTTTSRPCYKEQEHESRHVNMNRPLQTQTPMSRRFKTSHDHTTPSGKLANAMAKKIEVGNVQGAFLLWQVADKHLQTSYDVASRALQAMRILQKDKLAETFSDSLMDRIRTKPPTNDSHTGSYNRASLFRSMAFAYNAVKSYSKLHSLTSLVSELGFPVGPLCYTMLQIQLESDPKQPFEKLKQLIGAYPKVKNDDDIYSLLFAHCQRTLDTGSMTQILEFVESEDVTLGPVSFPQVIEAAAKDIVAVQWAEKLIERLLDENGAMYASYRLVCAIAGLQLKHDVGPDSLPFDIYEHMKVTTPDFKLNKRNNLKDKIFAIVNLTKLCAVRQQHDKAFQLYVESRSVDPSANVTISAILSPFNYSNSGNQLFQLVAQHIRGEMEVPGTDPIVWLPQLNLRRLEPASLRFLLHAMVHSDHLQEAQSVFRASRNCVLRWRLQPKSTIELVRYLKYHLMEVKNPSKAIAELIDSTNNFASSLLKYRDSSTAALTAEEHNTFATLTESALELLVDHKRDLQERDQSPL